MHKQIFIIFVIIIIYEFFFYIDWFSYKGVLRSDITKTGNCFVYFIFVLCMASNGQWKICSSDADDLKTMSIFIYVCKFFCREIMKPLTRDFRPPMLV